MQFSSHLALFLPSFNLICILLTYMFYHYSNQCSFLVVWLCFCLL
jgi:hypothetical protein